MEMSAPALSASMNALVPERAMVPAGSGQVTGCRLWARRVLARSVSARLPQSYESYRDHKDPA